MADTSNAFIVDMQNVKTLILCNFFVVADVFCSVFDVLKEHKLLSFVSVMVTVIH